MTTALSIAFGVLFAADFALNDPVGVTRESGSEAIPARQSAVDAGKLVIAANALLNDIDIAKQIKAAARSILRQHAESSNWSGRHENTLFGLAARELPSGEIRDKSIPSFLSLVRAKSIEELLAAKCVLDLYAESGLTDATALREAIAKLASGMRITGSAQGITSFSKVYGNIAVAFAFGEEQRLIARLSTPVELEYLKRSYRDILHRDARRLMQERNWNDAIVLWRHLHDRKLVSPPLYLDAARCFEHQQKHSDALVVLQEAYKSFGASASVDWLEQCGELALPLGSEGEALALRAFRLASEKMKTFVSP